jgi:hypothetical protein
MKTVIYSKVDFVVYAIDTLSASDTKESKAGKSANNHCVQNLECCYTSVTSTGATCVACMSRVLRYRILLSWKELSWSEIVWHCDGADVLRESTCFYSLVDARLKGLKSSVEIGGFCFEGEGRGDAVIHERD